MDDFILNIIYIEFNEIVVWIQKIWFYNRAHLANGGAIAYHVTCHEPINNQFIYN